MALIDDIKAIPSFKDKEDASAIVAHIKSLESKATKVDALQHANDAYKAQIVDLQEKEVEAFLDKAVAEGKIAPGQLPSMKKLMIADRETTESFINSMKPAKSLRASELINHDGVTAGVFDNKSWDDLDKQNLLAELKVRNKDLFCAKYKEKFGVDYKE